MLLVHVLRHWIDHQPPTTQAGWLQALRDPTVASALSLIHGQVGRPWTLASLAAEVGVSPSTLKKRFTQLTGGPPGAYLARWRIDTAARHQTPAEQLGVTDPP